MNSFESSKLVLAAIMAGKDAVFIDPKGDRDGSNTIEIDETDSLSPSLRKN